MESFVLSSVPGAVGLFIVKSGLDWARATVTARVGPADLLERLLAPGVGLALLRRAHRARVLITGVVPALRATGHKAQVRLRQFSKGNAGLRLGRRGRR